VENCPVYANLCLGSSTAEERGGEKRDGWGLGGSNEVRRFDEREGERRGWQGSADWREEQEAKGWKAGQNCHKPRQ
jgi:hypothetical protein